MKYKNQNDTTDDWAMGPCVIVPPMKTADGTYKEPGLPRPPAGYGRKLSIGDARERDEGN